VASIQQVLGAVRLISHNTLYNPQHRNVTTEKARPVKGGRKVQRGQSV
jgi:hypothetical protein